ncbi:MAG: retropepsin-like aspartic protease [bacterium]
MGNIIQRNRTYKNSFREYGDCSHQLDNGLYIGSLSERPFVEVGIRTETINPFGQRVRNITKGKFLVDTGSDLTLISEDFARDKLDFTPNRGEEPDPIGKDAGGHPVRGYERKIWIYLIKKNEIGHIYQPPSYPITVYISPGIGNNILGVNFIHKIILVYEYSHPFSYTHFYNLTHHP